MFFSTQAKSDFFDFFPFCEKKKFRAKKNHRYEGLVWVSSKLYTEFVMETETMFCWLQRRANISFVSQKIYKLYAFFCTSHNVTINAVISLWDLQKMHKIVRVPHPCNTVNRTAPVADFNSLLYIYQWLILVEEFDWNRHVTCKRLI